METEFKLKNFQMAYFNPQYFYSFKKEIFKLFCVSFRWDGTRWNQLGSEISLNYANNVYNYMVKNSLTHFEYENGNWVIVVGSDVGYKLMYKRNK